MAVLLEMVILTTMALQDRVGAQLDIDVTSTDQRAVQMVKLASQTLAAEALAVVEVHEVGVAPVAPAKSSSATPIRKSPLVLTLQFQLDKKSSIFSLLMSSKSLSAYVFKNSFLVAPEMLPSPNLNSKACIFPSLSSIKSISF